MALELPPEGEVDVVQVEDARCREGRPEQKDVSNRATAGAKPGMGKDDGHGEIGQSQRDWSPNTEEERETQRLGRGAQLLCVVEP